VDARERVRRALTGGEPDRVPYQDVFWKSTLARWRREGLPADVAPAQHFGCDIVRLGGDYTMQFPVRTLEEGERYRVYVDADGATRREIAEGDDWTPHWVDFTIGSADDWRTHRQRLTYNPSRIGADALDIYRQARQEGRFVAFSVHASFHPTWHKIGLERMLTAMIEEPEWPTEMMAAHAQLIVDLYDGMKAAGIDFDGAWLSDDLGYNKAPLISPAMYRDLVQPHHRTVCERFAADGLPVILHTDGDVRPLIDDFLDAGVTALHPLEAKAGLDVAQLSQQYGDRLALFGNIDVRPLAGTPEQVVAEVEETVGAGKAHPGGYLFHSDHSVPSDVSLANYELALETLRRVGAY
jgi:uroporphyrinogen decarboxylase